MKYKRLGLIVAFCFVSWLVLALVIFSDNLSKKIDVETRKGSLLKYIQELELQISQQEETYKLLVEKLKKLTPRPENVVPAMELKRILDYEPRTSSLAIRKDVLQEKSVILPVLVFSCNRPDIRRSLDGLLKYRPEAKKFPIIVSQDCAHGATAKVIRSYSDASQVTYIQQPDQSEPIVPPGEAKFKGYFKIARHYLFGLKQIFRTFNYTAVIIVEDDLDVAPDFFSYFASTYQLLKNDPTLWCVSAWNDNGKATLVDMQQGSQLLYRSDFFPGLGWMITKELWDELEPKWPKSYWDDWMRRPEQRKDRACIRPEISRTRTFGKIGVSNGMFFDKHLKYIKLNEMPVDFSKQNLSHMVQTAYDADYFRHVYSLPVVSASDVRTNTNLPFDGPLRITYHTKDTFKNAAKLLGLMDDFKSGVPRTGYHGIVSVFLNGRRVYLAPHSNWKGYDLTWS
ncbi:Alpha-1,3-mannosyl-glycoprotein 2-beta-N-acetylglucosaminyltransferase [Daphnia magna]|uniref:Alpha-1,3-mannosyl-glycoprotein 2-beta-N-acetylglucosaminyltransferase n=1 Tax=Daphnia magna TaxID=35525 RepID=A0A0P5Y2Z2_9CRUS|nr:Alpha-1,3-mannosyl-glycoprotein 2-beta-N-acetylglucosaminyltransferase [Daphnia magna]CAG4639196.1 EOG090X06K9 [Daphnia magna]SVE81327.1 EOG090X06K9 [Daphnia magna]SVE82505.1 EOG090X06K9 [Daphnia magna]SVE83082.1 EOG090X06K9 [Daphnia magna]